MKSRTKYRKYIVAGLIFVQIFVMAVPVYALETFSNWNDAENYIYENMLNRENKIEFVYNGSKNNYEQDLMDALKDTYSKDDYLERSWKEIKPEAYDTEDGIKTTLSIKYLCTKKQEEYVDNELKNAVNSIINEGMSDYDKVKSINDYIINKYEYDYSLNSISVYTALTTSEAVCQGYSMTAYRMFEYAGIKNRIVVGTARGISHSWNLVRVDGKWYQIDITNNDSGNPDKYFLVSDQFLIENNYIWDGKMYPSALGNYQDVEK